MPAHDRYQRIDALFDALLDLPAAEHAAFIDKACGDDAELRKELLDLLRAHERTGGMLDTPPVRAISDFFDAATEGVPAQVGPFRLTRAIGAGGMGQVFLGERADGQFEQRVAIKFLKHHTAGMLRRFLEERRILALLEHPGIARLVDGGITADGMPYFAMEFVDGEPIDHYCLTRSLPLDDRLRLFESVCDAVSYAHQHLVIHRDLKPSNILVTPEGQVKLLDFGIAKLLDARGERVTGEETRLGMRVMTPDVAAPEQVRGEPVSTTTDVYALGVLLYLMITGQRPYELQGKNAAEMERIICDVEPVLPSARVDDAWRRRVRGDLDLVVMTAMQKREERRYASPAAMADDVRRFRAGRPILARPDSAAYQLRKFVSRHRVGAVAATLVLLATGIGAVRERMLRARAEVEARKALEVEEFLVGVFDVADPFATTPRDGATITARDLLDRGAARIDSTLGTQPEVQAELRTVLGRVYANLGLFDRATPLLERSLAQAVAVNGESSPEAARSMDLLGATLAKRDRQDEAERLLRAALALRRRLTGPRSGPTAESSEHLATLLEDRNQFAAAESLHRDVLAIRQALHGDSTVEVANAVNNLALVRFRRGAYADAEPLYRRALDIHVRRLGEKHPLTAATMQNLAQTLQLQARLPEAEQLYRRSLTAKRAALGDLHPSVTIGLNNLGAFLANQMGRVDDGEAMVREAIALDRRIFGNEHSYVAEGLRNLGGVLRLEGRFAEADTALREALAIDRKLFGTRHQRVAGILGQLAQVRFQMGAVDDALSLMRESLDQYREFFGDDHTNTVITLGNYARLLTEAGKGPEAEQLALQLITKLDSANATQRPQYIGAHRTLASAMVLQGRAQDALPILEKALAMTVAQYGEDDWRTGQSRLALGNALVTLRRREEAGPVLRAALAGLQKHRQSQPKLAEQAAAAVAAFDANGRR